MNNEQDIFANICYCNFAWSFVWNSVFHPGFRGS